MATANLGRVGFVNKGIYSGATAYKVNDVVVYNSGTYACIQANTGQAPTNTSYWQNWVEDNAVHKTGDETIAGVKTLTDGLKLQNQNVSPFSGFKNYIINGGFDVWQRGTSFTGLTNGFYSADRWCVYDSVGDINYNVIRNAGIFTGGYGATYTWNSGTGIRSIIQFIENVTRFKVGSSVTVSFEAYTNSTPYSIGVIIQAVRGVWESVTAEVSSPIALTNTKTKYSVTLSVPDWSSIGIDWAHLEDTKLALKFDFAADTNGKNFMISNVQLEEGSVATPFENRPYGLELSLCQRYYERLRNDGAILAVGAGGFNSDNTIRAYGKVNTKRVNPSVVVVGNYRIMGTSYQGNAISSLTITALSNGAYCVDAATNKSFQANLPVCIESFNTGNDSYIEFLAEL